MHLTRWFRRHQRILLAVLVVMLMISFGVLGTIQSLVGRPEGTYGLIKGEVVSWSDMQDATHALQLAQFLVSVDPQMIMFLQQTGIAPRVTILHDTLMDFVRRENQSQALAAWRLLVLMKEAEAAAVEVTPGEATEFLTDLLDLRGGQAARTEVYQGLLRATRLNHDDAARHMLALTRVVKMIGLRREAVLATAPELWMEYGYAQEQARIRFVEVDAAWFTSLVDASEEDVRGFYEEHKGTLPDAAAGTLGYMAPDRVKVEYARPAIEQLAAEMEVSSEEVEADYEENKADYLIEAGEAEDAPADAEARDDDSTEASMAVYRPLTEVREEIRDKLARQKAAEEGRRRVEQVITELRARDEQFANEPRPLGQMARRYGLEYGVVRNEDGNELLSAVELESAVAAGASVAAFAFGEEWTQYYPEAFESDEGGLIVQVLERREPEPRSFESVKDQVRADLLKQKALARAETFAGKLRDAAAEGSLGAAADIMNARLKDLLAAGPGEGAGATLTVTQSEPFSRSDRWLPGATVPTPSAIERAFQLHGNDVGVATAGPPVSRCYVMQLIVRESAPADEFASRGRGSMPAYLMGKRSAVMRLWMDELLAASAPSEKLAE